MTYHDITLRLIDEFNGVKKYQNMVNLLKLFDLTDGAVFYIRDLQWTPFKDLVLLGPQFAAAAFCMEFVGRILAMLQALPLLQSLLASFLSFLS